MTKTTDTCTYRKHAHILSKPLTDKNMKQAKCL